MSAFWNGGQNCSANMRQIVDRKVRTSSPSKRRGAGEAVQASAIRSTPRPHRRDGDAGASRPRDWATSTRAAAEGASAARRRRAAGWRRHFVEPDRVRRRDARDDHRARGDLRAGARRPARVGPGGGDGDRPGHRLRPARLGVHPGHRQGDQARPARCPAAPCQVNAFSEGDVKTPFGGYKRSGSLARDNGAEAMDQYLQTKTDLDRPEVNQRFSGCGRTATSVASTTHWLEYESEIKSKLSINSSFPDFLTYSRSQSRLISPHLASGAFGCARVALTCPQPFGLPRIGFAMENSRPILCLVRRESCAPL